MTVAFDSKFLMLMIDPDFVVTDATGATISDAKERLEYLLATLSRNREKVIAPTPAVSELLVHAGAAGPQWLDLMTSSSHLRIAPFDLRAAVELAAIEAAAIAAGSKRGGSDSPWQKIKLDRQIVAIAKINGATIIYSDDSGVRNFATAAGLQVLGVNDLPTPPRETQAELEFDPPPEKR